MSSDIEDAVQMWVELAVHKYRAASEPVILGECSAESVSEIMKLIAAQDRNSRIDELERITKDTFDKPATPENQEDRTWQGGYGFAKNSLKRYKLDRIRDLKHQADSEKEKA